MPQTFIVFLTKDMDEHHGTQQERVNDDCSILLMQSGDNLNILFLSFQRMINQGTVNIKIIYNYYI